MTYEMKMIPAMCVNDFVKRHKNDTMGRRGDNARKVEIGPLTSDVTPSVAPGGTFQVSWTTEVQSHQCAFAMPLRFHRALADLLVVQRKGTPNHEAEYSCLVVSEIGHQSDSNGISKFWRHSNYARTLASNVT